MITQQERDEYLSAKGEVLSPRFYGLPINSTVVESIPQEDGTREVKYLCEGVTFNFVFRGTQTVEDFIRNGPEVDYHDSDTGVSDLFPQEYGMTPQ